MSNLNMDAFFQNTIHILRVFLLGIPGDSRWTTLLLVWAVRLVSFSLIFRTYIGPFILARMSDHIRVRSISLRSIRGLYIRKGSQTWRVDRIGISYRSVAEGLGGMSVTVKVKIQGLKLEIGEDDPSPSSRRRKLTLADLSPSPIAQRLWTFVASLFSWFDPFIRPLLRTTVVACLRIFIRYLPAISQAVDFDLRSAVVTSTALPETSVVIEEAKLNISLAFTQSENPNYSEEKDLGRTSEKPSGSYRVAAWKSRLTTSFRRAWERAWEETQGTASVSLKLANLVGSTGADTFFSLPGVIDLATAAHFSPKRGKIETHSLNATLDIGGFSVAVDVIQSLLTALKIHRERHLANTIQGRDEPVISPIPSGLSPSTVFPSPLHSPSLPSVGITPDPTTSEYPALPNSPFLEVLSASMLPSRRYKRFQTPRPTNSSWLSLLSIFKMRVSTITLTFRSSSQLQATETSAFLHELAFVAESSNPQNQLHREWLGQEGKDGTDAYAFGFSLKKLTLERAGSNSQLDSVCLLLLRSIEVQALMSQWPSPWLTETICMPGDPNAALIVARVALGQVTMSERLEYLQDLLSRVQPTEQKERTPQHHPPLFIPRVSLNVRCGTICGRIIHSLGADQKNDPFVIELRTNGFIVHAETQFLPSSLSTSHNLLPPGDLSLQLNLTVSVVLQPTFVRVLYTPPIPEEPRQFSTRYLSECEFMDDLALLSLETVEVKAVSWAVGRLGDDHNSVASIDLSSMFIDIQCSADALFIELWQMKVIAATQKLFAITRRDSTKATQTPSLDRPSFGSSITVSLARLVCFITAPDLNPNDDLDISRGLAFRTGISVQFCALQSAHVQYFKNLPLQSQIRQKLYLREDPIVEAVSAAKASLVTLSSNALFRVSVWNLALRSALATQYAIDDPNIAERDDPSMPAKDILQLPRGKADIIISRKQSPASPSVKDICRISMDAPYISGTFGLGQVYNLLLSSQTLVSIFGRQSRHRSPGKFSCLFQATIKTTQILWTLPHQKLYSCIDSITVYSSPEGRTGVKWNNLVLGVALSPVKTTDDKWEELARLQQWDTSISQVSSPSLSISVKGDNVRLRIPFGFILAELLYDLGITIKCVRHLTHAIPTGNSIRMSTPEPEVAKAIPNLAFRIRCVSLEAADDSFESKLNLIMRAGLDASKQRRDREEAFMLKVTAIQQAQPSHGASSSSRNQLDSDYQFSQNHTVSVEDAHQRLLQVHEVDWSLRHRLLKQECFQKEEEILQLLRIEHPSKVPAGRPHLGHIAPIDAMPPLFRVMLHNLSLNISPPSFPFDKLPDFMRERGNGIPAGTQFSLLIPMHLYFTLSSLRITIRDYPLPLIDIPPNQVPNSPALEFDTDLAIAEEMGSPLSVDWVDCCIVEPFNCISGVPLSISVPKTIMPVKTYANPVIRVATKDVTAFSWGICYGPTTQDIIRIVDSLSSSPRDSSPALGFWDKIRLVFHWSIEVSFTGDVHLHAKGSRDPYNLVGTGAGFVLCFRGHPKLLINHINNDKELVQVFSDSMLIAIPNLEPGSPSTVNETRRFKKVCAKLTSGVRFGVGIVLERTCGPECKACSGPDFRRKCRFFDFRPHHQVRLEKKTVLPQPKGLTDSFNGFRSDFIHMSVSLNSSIHNVQNTARPTPSSLHLTPNVFSHFWSWIASFDGALNLPIRQGSFYPQRSHSPKFGRHLATLKYRISLSRVYILHAYADDSRESWVHGVTPFVGVKAMVDEFQADMHQRDQETSVPGLIPSTTKVVRRKSVYAAEVVLKGLDLRAMLAVFQEPLKKSVPVTPPPEHSNYRTRNIKLPTLGSSSPWFDIDDFIETDWSPSVTPTIHLLPIVECPRLTYFNRDRKASDDEAECGKFGAEDTHFCLLGKEASVLQVQTSLAMDRISELRNAASNDHFSKESVGSTTPEKNIRKSVQEKMIKLLKDYVINLRKADLSSDTANVHDGQSYHIPSDTVSPSEQIEFENVYQIHCPKVFLSTAIRDIMMQYYYCSRARLGLEYHMATRAVKFIRDQAVATLASSVPRVGEKSRNTASGAQAAAQALRKMIIGNLSPKSSIDVSDDTAFQPAGLVDPLDGWAEGISLQKSHFCLLLKPQIVLRSDESVCVVAAVQGKLQSFNIMDNSNLDDPISGKIMSRSYSSLKGLQTFSPSATYSGDGCLPLEALIDFRCESGDFDRLVPQTDATFHYDKFNRLRLLNDVASVARTNPQKSAVPNDNHLQNQTDLIQVHIPQFTVSASEEHFQAISNIVTRLILFSDAAHKIRLDKLKTLLFAYDFTALHSAADVVEGLQGQLRAALETEQMVQRKSSHFTDHGKLELLKLKAHIFLLAEELDCLFEAIKLAQDRLNDHTAQKSALQLHASSTEISWRMVDNQRDLLAKLAVRDIDFSWLSRQDSSAVNNLAIGNLQAFDGCPDATWSEILCKYNEPANHPLLKRGLFFISNWTVLPPVGGITIYEEFELNFHPMRLQLDARVGRRIMEYFWPARRARNRAIAAQSSDVSFETTDLEIVSPTPISSSFSRSSLDSPRTSRPNPNRLIVPPLRKLGSSRSFTDLRSAAADSLFKPLFEGTHSSDVRRPPPHSPSLAPLPLDGTITRTENGRTSSSGQLLGGAAEMKTRSSQKTFVLVKISSLHLLLSVAKEQSFECRNASIRTHNLEYRNQTWSFEELVDQFIPSDTGWRGWVRMVFQQPLVPVLPVARELISKTKWIASKAPHINVQNPKPVTTTVYDSSLHFPKKRSRTHSPHRRRRRTSDKTTTPPAAGTTSLEVAKTESTDGSELADTEDNSDRPGRPRSRARILSFFSRASSRNRKSMDEASTEPTPPDEAGTSSRISSRFARAKTPLL